MTFLLRTTKLFLDLSSVAKNVNVLGQSSPKLAQLVPLQNAHRLPLLTPLSQAFSSTSQSVIQNNGNKDHGLSLNITESCKQRLSQILEQGSFLRVSVEGGGCSGFQYKFDVDDKLDNDDVVVYKGKNDRALSTQNNIPLVVIDETSLDLIRGSTLDYEKELIRCTFRIVGNPSAEQGCSCGASFNLKV